MINLDIEAKDIHLISEHEKRPIIEWYVTRWCNYNCDYCYSHNNKSKLESTETYIKRAKEIASNLSPFIEYRMLIKGGEVSYLDLDSILSVFKDYMIQIEISTNLSNNIDYYINLIKKFDIKLIASYHYLSNKKEFINKIKKISKYTSVSIPFVLGTEHDELYKEVMFELESLRNKNIKCRILPCKDKDDKLIHNKISVHNNRSIIINDKEYNLSILDIPSVFQDFSPKGYYCYFKYYFNYNIDHIEFHRCGDRTENRILCSEDKCNLCMVRRLERI